MQYTPLISCLCITQNKSNDLARAVQCFIKQDYPNKELLIVFQDNDHQTKALAESFQNDLIRRIEVESDRNLSLGELRNLSIEMCKGEYFCNWDDDDWYPVNRLSLQYNAIMQSRKPVSILINIFIYDSVKDQAYFSFHKMWEGSILCRKNIINEDVKYADLAKGEDSSLLYKLLMGGFLYPTMLPSLYIYVFHGNNTWGNEHFESFFSRSQRMPDKATEIIRNVLAGNFTNEKATELLFSQEVLGGLDYFHSYQKY